MYKPIVVFPFVEAGLGHIMPEKSVADAFEQKYGQYTRVVRTRFYQDTKEQSLLDYEQFLVRQVQLHNIAYPYGMFTEIFGNLWGSRIASWFVIKAIARKSFAAATKYMERLTPDMVFSAHWTTSYYANNIAPKPIVVSFCPDATSNVMFDAKSDLLVISAKTGYLKCLKNKRRYNSCNVFNGTFPIRQEAYKIDRDKVVNRKLFGIDKDAFVVVLADGAYGLSKLKKMTELLIKSDVKMTVVSVCGKNDKLYNYFLKLKAKPNIDFKPMHFCENMLNLTAAADVFSGKSGANAMMEPCFFNIPIVITKCVTFIERGNMKFYSQHIGNAVYENNARRAVKIIERLSQDKGYYNLLKQNTKKLQGKYGSKKIADKLWNMLCDKYVELKDIQPV